MPDQALPIDLATTLLGNGQVVTYKLSYHNEGEGTAPNVTIDLTAYGALNSTAGNSQSLALGDIAAGKSGEVIVTGTIDAPTDEKSAELDAVISDAIHGVYDRLWILASCRYSCAGKPGDRGAQSLRDGSPDLCRGHSRGSVGRSGA